MSVELDYRRSGGMVLGVFAAVVALGMAGCGTDAKGVVGVGLTNTITTNDPVVLLKIVEDTTVEAATSKEADRRFLLMGAANDPRRLATLERLLFVPGHSEEMAIYGIDELVKADRGRAERSLAFYFGKLEGEAVVAHACEVAVELKDPKLTGALVKSLAREERTGELRRAPEAKGIEKLSGKKLEVAVAEILADRKAPSRDRMDAMNVLRRITSDNEVKSFVLELQVKDHADGFMDVMRWSVDTWNTLPANLTEVTWCGVLREKGNETLVAVARKRHAAMAIYPDYEFALRYVYLLAMVDEASVKMTREELIAELTGELEKVMHVKRVPMHKKAADDRDETLEGNTRNLTHCDLLMMRVLMRALRENRVTPLPMAEGVADREDTGSEHGGLLRIGDTGEVVLMAYKPALTGSDYAYIASPELVKATVTGLGHYHFHFQDGWNEKIAGPSVGDMAYVKAQRCSGVVFTAVKGDQFDVDFYTPDGAVVDLGVYR